MYAKLKSLTSDKDHKQLQEFIKNSNIEELNKTLCDNICSRDMLKILDVVLQLYCESKTPWSKRWKLIENILKALERSKVSTTHANEIVLRVTMELPKYPKSYLVQLVELCISNISSNQDEFRSWMDIIPIVLEILEQEKYIMYIDSEISGSEYKSLIVENICNSHWEANLSSCLAKMFGDILLDKKDQETVMRALCSKLPVLPLNEVPPFVHQGLRVCRNYNCKYILEVLREYFASHYSNALRKEKEMECDDISSISLNEIQDTEGTVLYHIYHATQLHYKCISQFLLTLKKFSAMPEYVLEPFMLSTLFMISNVYDEQVFEILHQSIVRNTQNTEKRKNSAWLRVLIPKSRNVTNIIEQVINNSNKDRHLVLEGIMKLTFLLMDTDQSAKIGNDSLQKLGIQTLKSLMKRRHEMCGSVLQALTDKIIAGGSSVSRYTDCLAYACRKLTMIVLDYQTWIITLLDQLICMPGDATVEIIYAILPLIHISTNIRDNFILAMRKALYRKGTCTRKMAVTGFLEALKILKMNSSNVFSLSQSASSSTSSATSSSMSILTQVTLERSSESTNTPLEYNKSVCHDILNILRKCFTQECQVRSHLYEGLCDVVERNPDTAECVLEMLLAHFYLYFDSDENVLPPLKTDLCTDANIREIVLREPLAELIFTLQNIYATIYKSKSFDDSAKLAASLESLCSRMVRIELEHLNLDDATELLEDSLKAQEKLNGIKLMIGVYEALIAFKINTCSMEEDETAQSICSLFTGYNRLMDFINQAKKKSSASKGRKNKDTSNVATKKSSRTDIMKKCQQETVMDLKTIYKILSLLHSHGNVVALLKSNEDFYHYTLQCCVQLLRKQMDKHCITRNEKTYRGIGELFYKHAIIEFKDFLEKDAEGLLLALECFKEVCRILCCESESQLIYFLRNVCTVAPLTGFDQQLQTLISSVMSSLVLCMQEQENDEETIKQQIALMLMEIIRSFTRKVNLEERNIDEIFTSMKVFAEMEKIDASLATSVLRMLLWMDECNKEYGDTLNDVCLEVCEKMGMVHKVEIATNQIYKILQKNILQQAYCILNSFVKEKIDYACWLLERLKAEFAIGQSRNEEDESDVTNRERGLCRHLSYIIQTLHILTNVSIEPGQASNMVFKNLQQLYNLLSKLTKYFYNKSSKGTAAFHNVRFIQVIQLAGKPLKSAFYNLVTYIEETQTKTVAKKSKSDTHVQRNIILKETKIIPRVVYEIEQFCKEVLLLEKKTGVPLENYIKHSVTRDFRILDSRLTEALEQMDVSMLSTQNSMVEENTTAIIADSDNDASSD